MKHALLGTALLWPLLLLADGGQHQPLAPLVQEALEHNPDIQAARQRWEAAQAVVPQVRTLPDPKLSVGYRNMLPQQGVMYGVSQEIPFPGKLGLKGEIAAKDAERMEQEYRATQLAVVAGLKEAFYDLHFVHDAIAVLNKTKLLLEDFQHTAEARYAVGQAAQQDVFRAQTELSRLLARLASLEQRRQSLHADIDRLLNRQPSDPLAAPEEPHFTPLRHSLAELNALIGQSPLLLGREKSLEGSGQVVALAKKEYLPDFELDAQGMHDTAMRQEGYQVMLNVKVPLYFATKQREGVRQAEAERMATAKDLRSLRQELLSRIKDNTAQEQRAAQLVKLLGEAIIPQSRLTLASAQASYAVGKVDFLTLLNSLLTLQENEVEYHSELAEHEKALARLEGIIGEAP